VGPRRMMVGGLTLAGIIMLLLLRTTDTSSLWDYRAILFGRGLCWAFVFSPLQAAAFSQVSLPDTGRASSLFSTQRQVASSLGIAVLISLLMTQINMVKVHLQTMAPAAVAQHFYNAYKVPFFWTCLFAFAGAFAALFINDDQVLAVFRQREAPRGASAPTA
jgi:sugar phosphate permease